MRTTNHRYQRMRRKFHPLPITILLSVIITIWFLVSFLSSDYRQSTVTSFSTSPSSKSNSETIQPWQIPEWVQRYNVSHLFDWTWHKNGDFERCRTSTEYSPRLITRKLQSSTVVNDVLAYFRSHPDEGCIVDNVACLPNIIPHPLPRAQSWSHTCSALHIDGNWILCNKPQSEIHNLLPTMKRFVTIAVFNAYVDTGHCHPDVPGTIFTEHATFHLQKWTNNRCSNDAIYSIPRVTTQYRHIELINSIGTYLQASGHFGPQQLPRLLRLLATVPTTAKVLVAKGGVADLLVDVLVERGVVARDRIVPYDATGTRRFAHFANIVYRSEAWPHMTNHSNPNSLHDRTDMQLVHRVLANDAEQPIVKKDRVILIKRKDGIARSLIEHADIAAFIASTLNKSNMSSDLHLAIFDAQGHMRDHIALFRRARVIVGPHGAGMMNVLWASPGTHVVEIGYTTRMTFPQMYAEMSINLDQIYWVCKGHGDYSRPIHVDMDDFNYIFNRIIDEIKRENKRS